MPGFPKPKFDYDYDLTKELKALRDYPQLPEKADRAVPPKSKGHLLLATWNIANLGVQERREKDYRLIAEIISWFDLIAIQETNDDLEGLRGIQEQLPTGYEALFSDPGGNNERFTFLYDTKRLQVLEEIGRVTVPPKELKSVKLPDTTQAFQGFDRNPYLVSFTADQLRFVLANVHLYFGDESSKEGMERPTRPRSAAPTSATTPSTTRWASSPGRWRKRSSRPAYSTTTAPSSATSGATPRPSRPNSAPT